MDRLFISDRRGKESFPKKRNLVRVETHLKDESHWSSKISHHIRSGKFLHRRRYRRPQYCLTHLLDLTQEDDRLYRHLTRGRNSQDNHRGDNCRDSAPTLSHEASGTTANQCQTT